MDSYSTLQLSNFISAYQLKGPDSMILFDAMVIFYRHEKPHRIFSEIQIIHLPREMVLYILEFIKDEYYESDVYSTSTYHFHFTEDRMLEVRDGQFKDLLLFTISPLEKSTGRENT